MPSAPREIVVGDGREGGRRAPVVKVFLIYNLGTSYDLASLPSRTI